jgi:hypothetical protein
MADRLPPDKLEFALSFLENLLLSEKKAVREAEYISDRIREEQFVRRISETFADPDAANEQYLLAEAVANHTDIEELPW